MSGGLFGAPAAPSGSLFSATDVPVEPSAAEADQTAAAAAAAAEQWPEDSGKHRVLQLLQHAGLVEAEAHAVASAAGSTLRFDEMAKEVSNLFAKSAATEDCAQVQQWCTEHFKLTGANSVAAYDPAPAVHTAAFAPGHHYSHVWPVGAAKLGIAVESSGTPHPSLAYVLRVTRVNHPNLISQIQLGSRILRATSASARFDASTQSYHCFRDFLKVCGRPLTVHFEAPGGPLDKETYGLVERPLSLHAHPLDGPFNYTGRSNRCDQCKAHIELVGDGHGFCCCDGCDFDVCSRCAAVPTAMFSPAIQSDTSRLADVTLPTTRQELYKVALDVECKHSIAATRHCVIRGLSAMPVEQISESFSCREGRSGLLAVLRLMVTQQAQYAAELKTLRATIIGLLASKTLCQVLQVECFVHILKLLAINSDQTLHETELISWFVKLLLKAPPEQVKWATLTSGLVAAAVETSADALFKCLLLIQVRTPS